ncbi:MAG: Gldg family protein [Phototrophicales bacterium]|nr:Gldg family protein [Phototrophicales bacterium]
MRQTISIIRKELDSYFSSPMALIFVSVFLGVTFFTFFWVNNFWLRNLADVRPLFASMPLLMIFLISALTMRQWSEEQSDGTLELLFTLPMKTAQLVLGKFIAVLILVIVALVFTIILPITISVVGNPDWGPIIGGYIASLLLASAYIAIGLFVSSRTDNQIVALIITVLVCGAFHIIGTQIITNLVAGDLASVLRGLSTSARFESIERGVIDLRDVIYYMGLTIVFLALNILSLESKRWGKGTQLSGYRLNSQLSVALIAGNLLALSLLIAPVNVTRADLTADQQYTLSDVTRDLVGNLGEPLLVRLYVSERNHPLLAPLVPQLRDVLSEYVVASGGNMTLEVIDPINDPELESEANQTYGIRPTPLQIANRASSELLNVYFDLLIRYGDQSEVLNFGNLIQVEQTGSEVFVSFRNLEYDLTSTIKRVVSGFQNIDAVLASLSEPAQMTLYYTPITLPEALQSAPTTIQTVADDITGKAGGKFVYNTVDVDSGAISPQELFDRYGIRPIATDFFGTQSYYLHVVITAGDKAPQVIFPSGEVSEGEVRAQIESTLKRVSSGFVQVVGIWLPPDVPQQDMFGQQMQSLSQYNFLPQFLSESYEVLPVDLSTGQSPTGIDILIVVAPQNMSTYELYAIDQFLMRGGSVMVLASNYRLSQNPTDGTPFMESLTGTLNELLAHYGISVEASVVLDTQNQPFPIPVQRNVNGVIIQEIQQLDYPPFVDIRQDAMTRDIPITNNLPTVILAWASPLVIGALPDGTTSTTLLSSTSNAVTTSNIGFQPDTDSYPDYGFLPTGNQQQYTLAVALQGSFTSFFDDRPSPFALEAEALAQLPPAPTATPAPEITPLAESTAETTVEPIPSATPIPTATPLPVVAVSKITQSPANTRLIVVGSAEFVNDNLINLFQSSVGDNAINGLQLVQNSVDWFTEDTALATIRARGVTSRLLNPLTDNDKSMWEFINYAVGIAGVIGMGVLWRLRKRAEQPFELLTDTVGAISNEQN